MNISPELWRQIDPLLTDALEMEHSAREAWLKTLDETHPELAPLLRKMLASHDRAEQSRDLETVPRLAPHPPVTSTFSAGARIGPFALLRLLGRGGMGEVWLARQADGRVEREVALKLPTIYLHSDIWRERFRQERDILSKLNHPHIARLFDAGVSEEEGSDGQPYLAMEYVEGKMLTDFVTTHESTIDARLKLFRQILEAVAHAHRHLVVHRDLKPANILIDQSGQVKLLDFGIAKLIDDGAAVNAASNLTQLGGRMMTLRYAAPEQVSGGNISTATDTYALGTILHELLTGLSPYRAVREGKPLIESALLSEETALPSTLSMTDEAARERHCATAKLLSRKVAGDLDAILLKAMRKNPADRYVSIEQFDDDIGWHLDHRPVKAREGTWRYLVGRFIARYKLPLAASAAVLVSIVAGLVMVEQQRRVAVMEKARAEKHFATVRKLANSLIFDLNDKIEEVPGATKVRLAVMENATRYLDELAGESGADSALQVELANAYVRLGEILGATYGQSVGRHADALRQFDRAKALLTPNLPSKEGPASKQVVPAAIQVAAVREMLAMLERKSHVLYELSRASESAEAIKQAYDLSADRAAAADASIEDKLVHARMTVEHTRRISGAKRDRQIHLKGLSDAMAIVDGIRREYPQHEGALEQAAWIDHALGIALRRDPRPDSKRSAIEAFERSLAIREGALLRHPAGGPRQRTVAAIHTAIGVSQLDIGEADKALVHLQRTLQITTSLVESDPGNLQFQRDLTEAEAGMARATLAMRRYGEALAHARIVQERIKRMPRENADLLMTRLAGARVAAVEGEANFVLSHEQTNSSAKRSQLRRAKAAFQRSLNEYEAMEAQPQKPFSLAGDIKKITEQMAETERGLKAVSTR